MLRKESALFSISVFLKLFYTQRRRQMAVQEEKGWKWKIVVFFLHFTNDALLFFCCQIFIHNTKTRKKGYQTNLAFNYHLNRKTGVLLLRKGNKSNRQMYKRNVMESDHEKVARFLFPFHHEQMGIKGVKRTIKKPHYKKPFSTVQFTKSRTRNVFHK